MAYDERLASRIRRVLHGRSDITERKMFGGLAFMFKGRMGCGIVGNDLVVRVTDEELQSVMRQRHVRPMDFTGKPLRGFVYVSPSGFRTSAALCAWLLRGERFVRRNFSGAAALRGGTQRRPRRRSRSE